MSESPRTCPLWEAFRATASRHADQLALHSVDESLTLSFGVLSERIEAWARALTRAGISGESLVALSTGNTLSFPELFFGLRAAGAAALTLDASLGAAEKLRVCGRLQAGWIAHRDAELPGEPLPGAPDKTVRLLQLVGGSRPPPGTALVMMTSGSTLEPRGACLTADALVANLDLIARGIGLACERILLPILPSHRYGFEIGVLPLLTGTPVILQQDLVPAAVVRSLGEWKITLLAAVPALLRALSAVTWAKGLPLRRVISASARLPEDVQREFEARSGVRVHQLYGASECGGISFETRPEAAAAMGTVGFPLPGVQIAISEDGVLRVNSQANRFAILPEGLDVPSYVEVGDRVEQASDGRLRVLGRHQPFAKVCGVKIDLGVIEIFLRDLSEVRDAAVMAVPDGARGERIVAWVESETLTSQALAAECRRALSEREQPSEIRVVQKLPVNARGKVDRAALRSVLP